MRRAAGSAARAPGPGRRRAAPVPAGCVGSRPATPRRLGPAHRAQARLWHPHRLSRAPTCTGRTFPHQPRLAARAAVRLRRYVVALALADLPVGGARFRTAVILEQERARDRTQDGERATDRRSANEARAFSVGEHVFARYASPRTDRREHMYVLPVRVRIRLGHADLSHHRLQRALHGRPRGCAGAAAIAPEICRASRQVRGIGARTWGVRWLLRCPGASPVSPSGRAGVVPR